MDSEQLRESAKKIEEMRRDFLCDLELEEGPISGEHALLALAALDEARSQFMLAHYFRMRGD